MSGRRNWHAYLVKVLEEEVASRETEIAGLRKSVRYRLGGLVLEAFPPGPRTITVLFRLFRFYLKRRRTGRTAAPSVKKALPIEAMHISTIVFGEIVPERVEAKDVWVTDLPDHFARRLDKAGPVGTLIIRQAHPGVLRCLERARLGGWRVEWSPEFPRDVEPAMAAYVRAHADHLAPEVE